MNNRFEKATFQYQKAIFDPHVKEFWDNSQAHKDDILNFMNRKKEPSDYFGAIFTYWVGLFDDVAYCLIMTHEENESMDLPDNYKPYIFICGKIFGLDFCIGNTEYLGKGLAAPTLITFMDYFVKEIETDTDTFLIDPFMNNPRAIHVYQKAGFQIKCEFTQEGGYFDQSKGFLMVKTF